MYKQLVEIDTRPAPYEYYTAATLWDDDHISAKMLEMHLDPQGEPASRNHPFIQRSADWIMGRLNIGPGSRVADFGCGPGLYTTRFARSGASVVGIDFSRRSIAHARSRAEKEGLRIEYVLRNYLEFDSDARFDLITLIYCDLCALSDAQRKRLLGIFHRHLKEGGMLLLDVCSMKAFHQRQEASVFGRRLQDGFWSGNDYFGFLKTVKYHRERVVLDKYTIVEASRRFEVYNWLAYYSRASLGEVLSQSGFQIMDVYSDVAGRPYSDDSDTIAVIARRGRDAGNDMTLKEA